MVGGERERRGGRVEILERTSKAEAARDDVRAILPTCGLGSVRDW